MPKGRTGKPIDASATLAALVEVSGGVSMTEAEAREVGYVSQEDYQHAMQLPSVDAARCRLQRLRKAGIVESLMVRQTVSGRETQFWRVVEK